MPPSSMRLADYAGNRPPDDRTRETVHLLTGGGDERIVLDPETGLNKYHSAPYPRAVTAFASSTANDMSAAAFAHIDDLAHAPWGPYSDRLDALRARLRAAYQLPDDCRIVFAPSGTDLEYVALAAVGADAAGIHNVLLGADEVGSGCRLSAHGKYFAALTGRGIPVTAGDTVEGLEVVSLVDIPVRGKHGEAFGSEAIAAKIRTEIGAARALGRHALVHVVHGSKTGLILPALAELDALAAEAGGAISFVVDACQARITTRALHAYLGRGMTVFLTGSKFMGGPPFSGFALVPASAAQSAPRLPAGLAQVFRRAEWPEGWPGREQLADEDNPGLWLRLEASLFELERFQALGFATIERMVDAFQHAVRERLIGPYGLAMVEPEPFSGVSQAHDHPIAMRTLVTIDVSSLPAALTFDDAQRLHRELAYAGLRLGQPVRSVRNEDGNWGGTLRIGPAMPQFVAWAELSEAALAATLEEAMETIAAALGAVRRERAA